MVMMMMPAEAFACCCRRLLHVLLLCCCRRILRHINLYVSTLLPFLSYGLLSLAMCVAVAVLLQAHPAPHVQQPSALLLAVQRLQAEVP
jgi:hypothetical protein